jgi:hypothetical protein
MTTNITTVTDLKNYLYECRADLENVGPDAFDVATEALRSAVHPVWGSDWGPWLSDHQHLIDEAV